MSPGREVQPPGGMAPPELAELPDGSRLALRGLAEKISDAHLERHPEDAERYGTEMARAWCVHDNQHLLFWAAGDLDLAGQLAWLAGVLDARDYPVANLVDNVTTGADVLERETPTAAGRAVAERMRAAAHDLALRYGC
ncbi:MAG TPA: hypothetical protein VFN87_07930 [Solirubrobacteraceae bacterium]|nr:hypothetical protein [Solirubrobacteraceae bacterium]